MDATAKGAWEKYVFDDTYTEFLMQSQLYNQDKKYQSFAELVSHVPGAEKLHFLVSAAITGYLRQLNGLIPDIVNNNDKHFLSFTNYRFEIINSDINNKSAHKIAVSFYSPQLVWHETINDFLLVSDTGNQNNAAGDGMILTEMVRLQPFLSIYSISTTHYD
jgi:hypothetical protein